ncbi:hypothetical protein ABIF50_003861 [Bradyrhizobium diazoefficiens]
MEAVVTLGTLSIKTSLTPLPETMNQAGRQDVVRGKMWYHGDLDLQLAAAMSSTESASKTTSEAARRERRRSNSLLFALAVGFLVFGAAAGALYYALRPEVLRIAVGPPGSDDYKVVEAMADAFRRESRTVRLSPVKTDGAVESLALLGAGKADLAVSRGDLEMPAEAQTVAVVRKNFVVLWAPSEPAGKGAKRKRSPKIKEVADLAGAPCRRDWADPRECRVAAGHPERLRRGRRESRGDALWH